MAKPSISMPDALQEEIDDRRHATTTRSQWICEAVIARLNAEDAGEWDEPDAGDLLETA